MISSAEEFLLLLKKWKMESTSVVVIMTGAQKAGSGLIMHVKGKVDVIEEPSSVVRVSGPDNSFAMFSYEKCTFGYGLVDDLGVSKLRDVGGEAYDEIVCFGFDIPDVLVSIMSIAG